MTEPTLDSEPRDETNLELQGRIEKLERETQENRQLSERRLILAELKVEALQSNMIDLDGLQFLDISQIRLDENGNLSGGTDLIRNLKSAKPWLFSVPSSSSVAKVPALSIPRRKLAKDMSDEEYRVARANIVKRSEF